MIKQINSVRKKDRIGNKAWSLSYLRKHQFRIPETLILDEEARIRYSKDPAGLEQLLLKHLQVWYDPSKSYAVRSSSEMEDDTEYSFAGQFKTILNTSGLEEILEAIKEVWKSAEQIQKGEYYKKILPGSNRFGMGVIIQEMVKTLWSGVAFSINPITGRDEIIIEGVKGSGVGLVQKGDNPFRWKFIQGAWEEYDEAISPGLKIMEELVEGIKKLRKKCKTEVDIEWAFDGNDLYYLQCRSVTAQQFPIIYSNHISREVLPGIIKPLVWSVNIPLVNSAWIRLLEGLLGPLDIKPEQLSRTFYYRAYFNMGTMGSLFRMMGMPRNSLESLMGRKDPSGKSAFRPSLKTFQYLPRMTWFLVRNRNLSLRFTKKIARLEYETSRIKEILDGDFTIDHYPEIFHRIMEMSREAAYYNIIIPLVMQFLNRRLKRKMEKHKLPYEELDFTMDFPGLRDHNPQYLIQRCHDLWMNLPVKVQKVTTSYTDLANNSSLKEIQVFQDEFDGLLERFGHFSESGNDFSYPAWREEPDIVLSMVRQGSNKMSIRTDDLENQPMQQKEQKMRRAHYRAGKYLLYREMISSEYTRIYGLFRDLFLKTGQHLAGLGMIPDTEDVFLLTLEEHDGLLLHGEDAKIKTLGKEIEIRKQEIADYENISLPSVIYGEEPPPLARPDEKTMQGIPVSPGIFEGEIVVVKGYKDFEKKVEGAIMVIPFSDVGWTPILTRAGAIVSESGGMLSHASIIARELSIPAIASVDHACTIEEGKRARLDGFNGLLIIDN